MITEIMWIGLILIWVWAYKTKPNDSKVFNVCGSWLLLMAVWFTYVYPNKPKDSLDFFGMCMMFVIPVVFFILGFFSKLGEGAIENKWK